MTDETPPTRLQRLARLLADAVWRHLPELLLLQCVLFVVGLTAVLVGLKEGNDLARRVGYGLCAYSVLLLGILLRRQSKLHRQRNKYLADYVEELRDYTVSNIEPLRETVAALRDVDTEKPPVEVQQRPDGEDTKPLGNKERNTLLVLVAVLCKESKIDFSRPAKAAGMIQSLAVAQGIRIGETTIEGVLKRLPDAVEARSR